MTVKDLIKKLQEFDMEAPVQIYVTADPEEIAKIDTDSGETVDDFLEITDIEKEIKKNAEVIIYTTKIKY